MKENKMITQEEIDRILEYMNEHYEHAEMGTRPNNKLMHGNRTISKSNMLNTETFLIVFNGSNFKHVAARLTCRTISKGNPFIEGSEIKRDIFSLEELKELESKAKELEQFTLNLGLWK